MKKFFALVAVMTICAVSAFAQYTNQNANASITVNVAQNANVAFDSWSADGGIGSGGAASAPAWVVVGQSKNTNYAIFHVTGAGQATIDITMNITSSVPANVSISAISEDVANLNTFAGPTALVNNVATNRTFPGALGSGSDQWVRGMCTVTGVLPSSASTINFDVNLNNYSI